MTHRQGGGGLRRISVWSEQLPLEQEFLFAFQLCLRQPHFAGWGRGVEDRILTPPHTQVALVVWGGFLHFGTDTGILG